jgi:hypothetical protein
MNIWKLVGISEIIRLILIAFFSDIKVYSLYELITFFKIRKVDKNVLYYYYRVLNNFLSDSLYLSSKLTIISSNLEIEKENKLEDPFFEWLAGVIDGDGHFNLSQKGLARLQITMDIRDKKALYEIKDKLGGIVTSISNANALRYQLGNKKGLITLINGINGLIRNPNRILQMNLLCVKYGIKVLYPKPLTFNNGWFSGFLDSDGSIYFNENSGQVFLSVTQKKKYLLEPLISLYGGRVYILSPKIKAFKYVVFRKKELFNLIDNYFSKYPLKTKKGNRLHLIKEFYLVRINKNNQDLSKFKNWILFKNKWENYSD